MGTSPRRHTRRTSVRVVLGDAGLRQVINNLLFEDLGVVDEQLGPLVHQILGDVDAGRLPATVAQTHILAFRLDLCHRAARLLTI